MLSAPLIADCTVHILTELETSSEITAKFETIFPAQTESGKYDQRLLTYIITGCSGEMFTMIYTGGGGGLTFCRF